MTVRRAESSDGPPSMLANNLAAIRSALEGAGVEFIDQSGMGPGVRLRDRIVPKGQRPTLVRLMGNKEEPPMGGWRWS